MKKNKGIMRSIICIAMALVLVVGFTPTVASATSGHTIEVAVLTRANWSSVHEGYLSLNVNGTPISTVPISNQRGVGGITFTTTIDGEYSLSISVPGYVFDGTIINGVEGNSLNLGRITGDIVMILFVTPGQAPEPTPTPPVTPTPTPTPPVTTPTPPGTVAPNLHTASNWAHELINEAVDIGLVPTQLQNHYRNDISRAEFTALAVLFFELVTDSEITGRVQFNDSNDINVQKAAYLGLVGGTGGGNFSPNMAFNREQASVILDRLATAIGEPFPLIPPTFADTPQMSPWAVQSVGAAQFAGIVGGVGNNMFNPRGAFTIEQSIVTILRLFERHLDLAD